MLFELTQEVAEMIGSGNNDVDEKVNRLLSAMKDKKHLIHMSRTTLDLLLKINDGTFDKFNRQMLKWIETHFNDVEAISKHAKMCVVITKNKKGYDENQNHYFLPINSLVKYHESKLLTENASDYDFYKEICKLYYGGNVQDIKIENHSFHGSNIVGELDSVIEGHNYFLCIVDSDKDYPSDKYGETYKIAQRKLKQYKTKYPACLFVIAAHEKENLFPFNLYIYETDYSSLESEILIHILLNGKYEQQMQYINIKDEFKLDTTNLKFYEFYKDIIDQCKRKKSLKNKTVVKGIGNFALSKSSKRVFAELSNIRDKATFLEKKCEKQKYIITEWKQIAQKIFDFGCCLSDKINFNV